MVASSSHALFVVAAEGRSGKSMVALGLVDAFARRVGRVGVFRPVVHAGVEQDPVIDVLAHRDLDHPLDAEVGVTYDDMHRDPDAAMAAIVERYQHLADRCDAVVVVGTDYTEVASPIELGVNGRIAANIGVPIVAVVRAAGRPAEDVAQLVDLTLGELRASHASVLGVVVNRADPEHVGALRELVGDRLAIRRDEARVWVVPEDPLLAAPRIIDAIRAVGGALIAGDEELLSRVFLSVLMCAMTVENVLDRLADSQLCITAGDRTDLIVALAASRSAVEFPSIAALVLSGGFLPGKNVSALVAAIDTDLPIISSPLDSFETAAAIDRIQGTLVRDAGRKINRALATFEDHIGSDVVDVLGAVSRNNVVTPLMFELQVIERARASRRRIVLPEGDDDRILKAAVALRMRDVADLTILGDPTAVRSRLTALGLRLDDVEIIDPSTSERREEFARIYTDLRAHRGMDFDRAHDIVRDVSYFGTMMVYLGLADGMVSGAAHSTAHTVTPAFEIIKTQPGIDVVSSVFFMCLADRVLVYGDCAIIPEPTVEQLADIAIASAGTAAQFGIEPRVAMLSYSTGASGAGAEVDRVRAATVLARQRRPDLKIEGPVQYDAAVDAGVAASKLPGSDVAGKATVLIFPDLNTGNNTYKAVQRSAGAVAVGPVLQGLAKPVNDLSRGATVRDIINTVAITAAQATGLAQG